MVFDSVSSIVATAGFLFLCIYAVYSKATPPTDVPPNIPLVGLKPGLFSILRARIASITDVPTIIREGYLKARFSKTLPYHT